MKSFLRKLAVVALLAGIKQGSISKVAAAAPPLLTMTIHVYDLAAAGPAVLARAKRVTARVFRETEVEIVWLECPATSEPRDESGACSGPMQATHLLVKILPKGMAKALQQSRGIHGFAVPEANGRFGHLIYLFHARILDVAYYGGIGMGYEDNQAIVLGNMMAHEIGHLLLGPNSHSKWGIMKSPWDRRELQQAARTGLRFTPQQVVEIHKALAERAKADAKGRSCSGKSVTETRGHP